MGKRIKMPNYFMTILTLNLLGVLIASWFDSISMWFDSIWPVIAIGGLCALALMVFTVLLAGSVLMPRGTAMFARRATKSAGTGTGTGSGAGAGRSDL